MKLFRYWAAGEATVQDGRRPWKVRGYGGSNEGMEQARRRAAEAAERIALALQQDRSLPKYGYADRPLREEIVEELSATEGNPAGVITRNSYGALVLNTNRVMFADVDYFPLINEFAGRIPPLRETIRELWDWLRGRRSSVQLARDEQLMSRFHEVVRSRPGMGLRVYRTVGGYRLLVTSGAFDPVSAKSDETLSAFGSDPLYMRLCKTQECFRARLSAKFWRCGAERPPSRYPWANAAEEAEYRRWEQAYHARANEFATCEFVESIGEPSVDPVVQPILEVHDRLTIRAGAPLA